jgi:hypothetical protein
MLSPLRAAAAILIAMLAAGCTTAPGRTQPDDRWEGFNRGVYKFNDTVDRAALKPVAKGYRKITPHFLRVGIGNFLGNLEYPATVVNQFLQGKPKMGCATPVASCSTARSESPACSTWRPRSAWKPTTRISVRRSPSGGSARVRS